MRMTQNMLYNKFTQYTDIEGWSMAVTSRHDTHRNTVLGNEFMLIFNTASSLLNRGKSHGSFRKAIL